MLISDLRPSTLLKKRLWHRCFPVKFAKFLGTPFLQNTPNGCFWQLQYLSVYQHYIFFWIFFLLSQSSDIRRFHFISFQRLDIIFCIVWHDNFLNKYYYFHVTRNFLLLLNIFQAYLFGIMLSFLQEFHAKNVHTQNVSFENCTF